MTFRRESDTQSAALFGALSRGRAGLQRPARLCLVLSVHGLGGSNVEKQGTTSKRICLGNHRRTNRDLDLESLLREKENVMPRGLNKWIMAVVVTAVAVAVIFRVPQIKRVVIGDAG